MTSVQGNIKDKNGNKVIPNTSSMAVWDAAKGQALSATLANTPDMGVLGYPNFSTVVNYAAGDRVYNLNKIWEFNQAHTGAWNAAHVDEISLDSIVSDALALITFLNKALGKYAQVSNITLAQSVSGKYVNTSGVEVVATGYGISAPFTLNFGDILLIPSASAVPAACSVVSRIVQRTYDKVIVYTYTYNQTDPTLYDTATADYDSSLVYTAVYDTTGETPVLTGWTRNGQTYTTLPATRQVTESYYEPLVKQAVSAMPDTGYYVYLCPKEMTVVVSGLTATVSGGVCQTVGLGIFKNIVSNFLSMPGQNTVAQALCDLEGRVSGLTDYIKNLRNIDLENQPKVCGADWTLQCDGAPTFGAMFIGQWCHAKINNKINIYRSISVTNAAADWVLVAVQS